MNRKIFALGSLPFLIASFSLVSCQGKAKSNPARDEFNDYINHLEKFPCSFTYNDVAYQGLDKLNMISHDTKTEGVKEQHIFTFSLDVLTIKVDVNYYEGYDAFDWTLYFTNAGATNSKILSHLNGLDYRIEGTNPHLKGIHGDHEKEYEPYEYDLSKRTNVGWRNELGRASHRYFPYFNLENDKGGAILALGWAGTWECNFESNETSDKVSVKFNGPVDLTSYLKPGETVRTPLNAVVRYYERDEDKAMNKWRRWYIDCNMPYQDKTHTQKAQPIQAFCLASDNDNPFSDGSISETYKTYKPSLQFLYDKGIRVDVRWFDAGWYERPDNTDTPIEPERRDEWERDFLDWWGTVGTWEMDGGKWPMIDDPSTGKKVSTFQQSVDYAAEHKTMTMVWYEPERVASGDNPEKPWLDKLCTNYGFKKEWILKNVDSDNYHTNIVNLGNPDAYNWVKGKIINSLKQYGIKIYREDFNCDPAGPFHNTDVTLGENRIGITENLYYQNHYKLWDEIIKTTSIDNNGCAFVDACASGGGRNDLESMRRGVPMLRSDADRTTIPLRLSYSHSLNPWLPYTGCSAQESAKQLVSGYWDQYVLRASYMSVMTYGSKFRKDQDKLDYNVLKTAQNEWDEIKHYFYKDYYNLTPYTTPKDDRHWNAYMYFDNEKDDGVIQVFRQKNAIENTRLIKIKGVANNHNYQIIDKENKNGIASISGAKLKEGITIKLDNARSSSVLFIKPL